MADLFSKDNVTSAVTREANEAAAASRQYSDALESSALAITNIASQFQNDVRVFSGQAENAMQKALQANKNLEKQAGVPDFIRGALVLLGQDEWSRSAQVRARETADQEAQMAGQRLQNSKLVFDSQTAAIRQITENARARVQAEDADLARQGQVLSIYGEMTRQAAVEARNALSAMSFSDLEKVYRGDKRPPVALVGQQGLIEEAYIARNTTRRQAELSQIQLENARDERLLNELKLPVQQLEIAKAALDGITDEDLAKMISGQKDLPEDMVDSIGAERTRAIMQSDMADRRAVNANLKVQEINARNAERVAAMSELTLEDITKFVNNPDVIPQELLDRGVNLASLRRELRQQQTAQAQLAGALSDANVKSKKEAETNLKAWMKDYATAPLLLQMLHDMSEEDTTSMSFDTPHGPVTITKNNIRDAMDEALKRETDFSKDLIDRTSTLEATQAELQTMAPASQRVEASATSSSLIHVPAKELGSLRASAVRFRNAQKAAENGEISPDAWKQVADEYIEATNVAINAAVESAPKETKQATREYLTTGEVRTQEALLDAVGNAGYVPNMINDSSALGRIYADAWNGFQRNFAAAAGGSHETPVPGENISFAQLLADGNSKKAAQVVREALNQPDPETGLKPIQQVENKLEAMMVVGTIDTFVKQNAGDEVLQQWINANVVVDAEGNFQGMRSASMVDQATGAPRLDAVMNSLYQFGNGLSAPTDYSQIFGASVESATQNFVTSYAGAQAQDVTEAMFTAMLFQNNITPSVQRKARQLQEYARAGFGTIAADQARLEQEAAQQRSIATGQSLGIPGTAGAFTPQESLANPIASIFGYSRPEAEQP